MPTSTFLAKLIGPVMLAVGIGMLANRVFYRVMAEEFLRSRALIYVSGLLLLPAGLAIVLTHNVWTADWPVVLTILGWLMTIGGALRIIVPRQVETIGRRMLAHPATMTAGVGIWLALGALLCVFGYLR